MKSFRARHTCDSQEWYTPMAFVDAAKRVFGGVIDLDPASHAEANARIKAKRIYTARHNGLIRPWRGRVFVNPPAGFVREFWIQLVGEYQSGRVKEAIWIGYSIEQIQMLQNVPAVKRIPIEFMTCWPRKRIAFIENAAKRRARIRKLRAEGKAPNMRSQPAHANYITYLGPNGAEFRREFSQFGKVISGRRR